MNDNEARWTRLEGPSGADWDSNWVKHEGGAATDGAWLPVGLEEAIRADERGAQAARDEALREAAQQALDYFDTEGLVSTDERGYQARDALRAALLATGAQPEAAPDA